MFLLARALASSLQLPYPMKGKKEKQSQLNSGAHKSKIREAEMGGGASLLLTPPYKVAMKWARHRQMQI